MKKLKQILSITLCFVLLLSSLPLSTLATEPDNSIGSIGTDYVAGENGLTNVGNDAAQEQTSLSQIVGTTVNKPFGNQEDIEVYVTKASTYTVTIPKTIILSGANGVGRYSVKIEGDLAGNEYVMIIPDYSFTLFQNGKNNITAKVEQTKIAWHYTNLAEDGFGTITADKITAGKWNGYFSFRIFINNKPISAEVTDKNGNNLNATYTTITGEEKTSLLSKLINDGIVSSESEIDAIINVSTDSFEGSATATFDVSTLAKRGDRIAVFHFNKSTQKWEYVAFVTVDSNNQITATFNSFSPVVLMVINSNTTANTIHENIIPEGGQYRQGSTYYNAGEQFPERVNSSDNYWYGDYQYIYNSTTKGWRVVLNTKVTSKYKVSYGEILEQINGVPVLEIDSLFKDCKNLTIAPKIPNTVTNIHNAYRNCKLLIESPIIPDSVTNMSYTFYGCESLTKAPKIPNGVTDLSYTFYTCKKLEDVSDFTVPNGVTNMTLTFYYCQSLTDLSHMVIPGGTKLDQTFYDCTALTYGPVLSEGITYMGGTFKNCSSMIIVSKIPSTVTDMRSTFYGCTNLKTYYENTDVDGDFSNYIIPENVNNMDSTFSNCKAITHTPILPEDLLSLRGTFSGCTALTTVTMLPKSVQELGSTFSECTSLTTVPDIPNSVTSMSGTFYNCTSLKNAPKLSENLVSMSQAFFGTAIVTAPEIPNGVTNLGKTFKNCKSLKTAPTIPASVTTMYEVFYGCYALTGTITVHANPTNYSSCFSGVDFLYVELTGTSTMLDTLGKTGYNYVANGEQKSPYGTGYTYTYLKEYNGWTVNVKDLEQESYNSIYSKYIGKFTTAMINTFENCSNMKTAPAIPDTVLYMINTFKMCTSLTGNVTINVNPLIYDGCFDGVDFQAQKITLIGNSTLLDTIGATGLNYCAECNGYCSNNH